jgi:hypothetical protein
VRMRCASYAAVDDSFHRIGRATLYRKIQSYKLRLQ